MRSYFRVMLGKASRFAPECFSGGFIGTDFEIHEDLSGKLPDEWRDFNRIYIPIFLQNRPEKSRIGAGLACGALWTVSREIARGDVVLCPDGSGGYRVGRVLGGYYYAAGQILPHRRKVEWLETAIDRSVMSQALRRSAGSIGTVCNLSAYRDEIEALLGAANLLAKRPVVTGDPEVEDPVAFAMEKHLEAFLVANWNQTPLSQEFLIFEEEGELVGQQYATDAGPIDILAVSRDRKRLLVVELKRGRVSDVVVGQVLRYMGYVKEQLATPEQTVEGAIIALEDDQKLRWALLSVPSIAFYRYQVSFKLLRV